MNQYELRAWIDEMSQDIDFEYLGVCGVICPFSSTDISMCYDGKDQTFDSIDAVMNTPFFDGKSLAEVCHEMNF